MRLLDKSNKAPTLVVLALSEDMRDKLAEIIRRPTGAILATGPTGSGKSTTLYAAMTEISSPAINIITVEDPVEFRLPGVNQVQINARAGLTFAAALRSILRSDPDVVMVGEIRDSETAKISIEAALTGYQGRIGIFQLLVMSENLENLAASGANREELERAGISEGMRTLWDDGLAKVASGLTSIEEHARVTT